MPPAGEVSGEEPRGCPGWSWAEASRQLARSPSGGALPPCPGHQAPRAPKAAVEEGLGPSQPLSVRWALPKQPLRCPEEAHYLSLGSLQLDSSVAGGSANYSSKWLRPVQEGLSFDPA